MSPRHPVAAALSAVLLCATWAAPLRADEFPANHLMLFTSDVASVPFTGSVRLLDADGQEQASIFGLANPECGVIGPTGRLFVLSRGDDPVRVVSPAGEFGLIESVFPAGPVPVALAVGPNGKVYVASQGTDVVYVFDVDGTLVRTLGQGEGLDDPVALAFGPGGHLFVASAGTGLVHEFDPSGVVVGVIGGASDIASAGGMAFGTDGRLFVSSPTQDLVHVFDVDGSSLPALGSGVVSDPAGLVLGPDGHLHVVSRGDDKVHVFDRDGGLVRTIDPGLPELNSGIAFVPYRFAVSFDARLYADGASIAKPELEGVLSLSPGSQRMMLHFTELDSMAGVFDQDQLVLHGFEARPGEPLDEKKRLYQGRLIDSDVVGEGSGSLSLLVTGKFGPHGWYQIKKAEGDYVRGAAAAGTFGELRTGELLE